MTALEKFQLKETKIHFYVQVQFECIDFFGIHLKS